MSKIDIDKFVEHLIKWGALDINAVQSALYAQGLILCNYTIQRIKEEAPEKTRLLNKNIAKIETECPNFDEAQGTPITKE